MSFSPPPYPYERLDAMKKAAEKFEGGPIDCSIGTPVDAPPTFVLEELARGTGLRGYPPSIGTPSYRESCANWMNRRFSVSLTAADIAACIGTKEFVASLAGYLHLRSPEKDTVLYPQISYPTYAMGATLGGLRAAPVPLVNGKMDLSSIEPSDISRALVLWSNSPSNPTGDLDDLEAVASWGRQHGVLVASDECYAEFTWSSRPRSIIEHGVEGVLAVHSISKRSNLAGIRAGFYTGDPEIVSFLKLVRQHAGFMVPGPVQSAVAMAYDDDEHVFIQRDVYHRRLQMLSEALSSVGITAPMPEGSFYLWCHKEGYDGWQLAQLLAETSGIIASPGEFYGEASNDFARIAMVQPDERLSLAISRLQGK